jgi:hypothetical protein
MNKRKFWYIPAMIVGGIGLCFLLSLAMMYLWNWLMPEIFHLPSITYWQAIGLFILSRFLFGGWKVHEKSHMRKRRGDDFWHDRFEEKLNSMRPEEKDKFRETWKKHFDSNLNQNSPARS